MRNDRIHAWLLRIGAAAIVAYWVEFFTTGRNRTSDDEAYLDFEKSFVLADAYVAVMSVAAASLLARGRPGAVPAGVAAGSGLTFLGLMDLTYDLHKKKLGERTAEVRLEKAIIASTLVFGPATMIRLGRRGSVRAERCGPTAMAAR